MDVEKYSKTFSVDKGPFAWGVKDICKTVQLKEKKAYLYPFMPYEKPMAIVIWWMEVVYIHWVMVGNQGSGVKSKMLQGASHRINLRSHHGFLSTTLVHPGHSI